MTRFDRAYEWLVGLTALSAIVTLLLFLGAAAASFLGLPAAYGRLGSAFGWSAMVFGGLYVCTVVATLAAPDR